MIPKIKKEVLNQLGSLLGVPIHTIHQIGNSILELQPVSDIRVTVVIQHPAPSITK